MIDLMTEIKLDQNEAENVFKVTKGKKRFPMNLCRR